MADVGLYRVSAARSDIIMLKEYFDTNHPDLNRKLQECDIHTSTSQNYKIYFKEIEKL